MNIENNNTNVMNACFIARKQKQTKMFQKLLIYLCTYSLGQ